MLRLPPPPEPPQGSEQWLHQLASYYRQLVGYHQQAAQTAARQLAHLEVLLGGDPQLPQETISWLTESQIIENPQEQLDSSPSLAQLSPSPPSPIELTNRIAALLATEKGHVVHIDYIVRKLYGQSQGEDLDSITAWVRLALEGGEAQGKWLAIPDAPDCWTLDPLEPTTIEENKSSAQITLTTKEVAQLLNTSSKVIVNLKSRNTEKFQEGTHYLLDKQNWYYWKVAGIELIKSLLSKSSSRRSKSKEF